MNLEMNAQMILRLAGFLICLVGLIFWLIWARRDKKYRLLAITPISYILHVLLFYAYNILNPGILSNTDVNTWSLIIRLQAAIMITSSGIIMSRMVK